ncbi:transmembrane protein 53 [Prorops nasuta]|uniref:transmembrane protein 53 n=1 Tax=Prorops nasuta TaxID=863751 RepID=UPI0034CFFD9B
MNNQQQDELDHLRIVYPSSSSSTTDPSSSSKECNGDDQDQQKDEFVFVYEDDKKPVVVLLGWAGCQDKYLAKYSAIYEKKSCITVRYTAPVECLFWRTDRMPYIGQKLLEALMDKNLEDHPIFFHVFSNGGAATYQHVSLAMQKTDSPLKVKGVIFDSAPGERRLITLFKAISAILGGHPLTNLPMTFFITLFLSVLWFFEILGDLLGKEQTVKMNPINLAEETYSWPQLFLYSNVDSLIPAADVEKFANRRAERGVRVQMVLFTDSPHVKHYATYQDVYVNSVCNFIHESLMSKSQEIHVSEENYDEHVSFDSATGLMKRVVLPAEVVSEN